MLKTSYFLVTQLLALEHGSRAHKLILLKRGQMVCPTVQVAYTRKILAIDIGTRLFFITPGNSVADPDPPISSYFSDFFTIERGLKRMC